MDNEDELKVWCGNLSPEVDEELLYELFLQVGPVKSVKIPVDNKTGKNQQYGFVTFKHKCSVPYAIQLLHDTELCNKKMIVRNKGGQTKGPQQNMQQQQQQHNMQRQQTPMNVPFIQQPFHQFIPNNNGMMPQTQVMGLPLINYAENDLQNKSRPNYHRGNSNHRNTPYNNHRNNHHNSRHYDRNHGERNNRYRY